MLYTELNNYLGGWTISIDKFEAQYGRVTQEAPFGSRVWAGMRENINT